MLRRSILHCKTREGMTMASKLKDFLNERAKSMADQAKRFRADPLQAARKASKESAAKLKSLNDPIRAFARKGVKLTAISQGTAQSLIELQTEIVTTALSEAAARLERVSRTVSVTDMVRGQGAVLKSARDRIVDDMSRAVKILRHARGEIREVAKSKPAKAQRPAKAAARKRPAGKAKRPARKAK
jgi:hypothetical protein